MVHTNCSWPNSVKLVEVGGDKKYGKIILENKELSCTEMCNSTFYFYNVVDSQKILKDNHASCICNFKSDEKKLVDVCS